MVWWCPSVCLGLCLSDQVSIRPLVTLFSYMLSQIEIKFYVWLHFNAHKIKLAINFHQFLQELCLFWTSNYCKYVVFPTFLLHDELLLSWNFVYFFVFYARQIKCFPSNFVGVMPLFKPKILEIRGFPHLSHTCFDILKWNLI